MSPEADREIAGPAVGVGAVVVEDGRVVLIRRGKEPLKGRWSVPGGTVELGETLPEALVREVREETGLLVRPLEVLLVFDRIERDVSGRVVYHYVVVDYLCECLGGELRAGSDAEAAALVRREDVAGYELPDLARKVVEQAFARAGEPPLKTLAAPPVGE